MVRVQLNFSASDAIEHHFHNSMDRVKNFSENNMFQAFSSVWNVLKFMFTLNLQRRKTGYLLQQRNFWHESFYTACLVYLHLQSIIQSFLLQLQSIGNWAETFVFHVVDKENDLETCSTYQRCIHGKMQNVCERKNLKRNAARITTERGVEPGSKAPPSEGPNSKGTLESRKGYSRLCYVEDELKYRMTRFSLENINLFIVEAGCACNVEVGQALSPGFLSEKTILWYQNTI